MLLNQFKTNSFEEKTSSKKQHPPTLANITSNFWPTSSNSFDQPVNKSIKYIPNIQSMNNLSSKHKLPMFSLGFVCMGFVLFGLIGIPFEIFALYSGFRDYSLTSSQSILWFVLPLIANTITTCGFLTLIYHHPYINQTHLFSKPLFYLLIKLTMVFVTFAYLLFLLRPVFLPNHMDEDDPVRIRLPFEFWVSHHDHYHHVPPHFACSFIFIPIVFILFLHEISLPWLYFVFVFGNICLIISSILVNQSTSLFQMVVWIIIGHFTILKTLSLTRENAHLRRSLVDSSSSISINQHDRGGNDDDEEINSNHHNNINLNPHLPSVKLMVSQEIIATVAHDLKTVSLFFFISLYSLFLWIFSFIFFLFSSHYLHSLQELILLVKH